MVNRLLNGDRTIEKELYPVGIPAMLLAYGASPEVTPRERVCAAYRHFASLYPREQRIDVLKTLAAFGIKSQGQDFLVWEPVFLSDQDEAIRFGAAHAALVLSGGDNEPLNGAEQLMSYVLNHGRIELLNGAFLTCDMRLLPLVEETWMKLPEELRYWEETPVLSLVSAEFLVGRIEKASLREERKSCLSALSGMPGKALERPPVCLTHPFPDYHPDYAHPQVLDAVTPLPAWKFPTTAPQSLHSWACPEFLPRFLYRIENKLTEEEVSELRSGWS